MSLTVSQYWNARYRAGRSSGEGSEGARAMAKAQRINDLIRVENVCSIVDWGVGDGAVLSMVTPDVDYLGTDVAPIAIARLAQSYRKVERRAFKMADVAAADGDVGDMAMSLDVIFHCVWNDEYDEHLRRLFASARRLVLVHATDHDGGRTAAHVRWRQWTPDVAERFGDWTLAERAENPELPGFYLLRRT